MPPGESAVDLGVGRSDRKPVDGPAFRRSAAASPRVARRCATLRATALLAWLTVSAVAPKSADAAAGSTDAIRVAAAVSLSDAMPALVQDFSSATGVRVELSYGSTGQLLAQIRHGAEFDVFIAAARAPVTELDQDGLLKPGSVRGIARNQLVLITPSGVEHRFLTRWSDLADPRVRRIVIGEPATVPAGHYAAQALEAAGLADATRSRILYASHVRQALDYVCGADVDAGVVYSTDARAALDRVRVVAVADPGWHDPIECVAAVLRSNRTRFAGDFVDHLCGDASQKILLGQGFLAPEDTDATPSPGSNPATPASAGSAPSRP